MKPYLALTLLSSAMQAQAQEAIPPAPTADSATPAYGADLEALQLELAGVESQHQTAINVHIASAVFGVLGAGSIVGALGIAVGGFSTSTQALVGSLLVLTGGVFSIVNIVLTIVGASLDLGSASHRRKLIRAHPEFSPGPGDVGVSVTLSF